MSNRIDQYKIKDNIFLNYLVLMLDLYSYRRILNTWARPYIQQQRRPPMREEIKESVKRMTKEDCKDVQVTMGLKSAAKKEILKSALENEDIAEYVLMY